MSLSPLHCHRPPARTQALRRGETLVGVALSRLSRHVRPLWTRTPSAFPSARSSETVVFPATAHRRALGRPGNAEKCDACEEILRTTVLMLEVYPLTKDTKIVHFHGDCYAIWNDERHAPTS